MGQEAVCRDLEGRRKTQSPRPTISWEARLRSSDYETFEQQIKFALFCSDTPSVHFYCSPTYGQVSPTTKPLQCFPHQNLYAFFIFPMPATRLTRPYLLDLIPTKMLYYVQTLHSEPGYRCTWFIHTLQSLSAVKLSHTSHGCAKEFLHAFLISPLTNSSVLIHYGSSWWAPEPDWMIWLKSNICSYGQLIVTTLTELLRYWTCDRA
jgi:hypothetical protein